VNTSSGAPLHGVRVLELGTMYASPTLGRMLRDFGATVIKVEDPTHGDFARQWSPMKGDRSIGFARLNSGKRSIAIDLRAPEGRKVIKQLAATVDIVTESFRPGRLEEWGLGYDQLAAPNPRLILTRISGFGQTGPYRHRPGFGTVAETVSGFTHINGWPDKPPTAPPFGFADSITGIAAAMGTAMMLYQRERSGRGGVVDAALYEPLLFIIGDMVLNYEATGTVQNRPGNTPSGASPRGVYVAGDGKYLSLSGSTQRIAERLFQAMGRADLISDPRFATNADRLQHDVELQAIVAGWAASMPRSEVLAALDAAEVVSAPVNDARDVAEDEHFSFRTLRRIVGDSGLGDVRMPGPIVHLRDYEGPDYPRVPEIGEHTDAVLNELGLDLERQAALRESGVIR